MHSIPSFGRAPGLFQLLAHNIRWNFVTLLARSDYCGQELVHLLKLPQNLVTYHLTMLSEQGLVTERQHSKPKPGKAFSKSTSKGASEHEAILALDDLSIDMAQRLVYRNDSIVDLRSSNFFDLLVYLVHHRGMIVTYDQWLHDVWGYDAEDRQLIQLP